VPSWYGDECDSDDDEEEKKMPWADFKLERNDDESDYGYECRYDNEKYKILQDPNLDWD